MSLPSINTFSPSTTAESAKVNDNFTNLKNRTDIAPTSADHITLTAGTSKLVRTTVLRQDDTTDTYATEQVILTGWGWQLGDSSEEMNETVTFGITFATPPVVTVSGAGMKTSSDPTTIDDLNTLASQINITTEDIATTGFEVHIRSIDASNLLNTRRYGYCWTAIGTLS